MKSPLDYLEEVQAKPEPVRRAVALAAVAILMAIIITIWIAGFSLAPTDSVKATAVDGVPSSGQPSPFTLLWNFVKESMK